MKSFTDLFLEEIENEIYYLYVEKKTREEYRMEKFKKKHDYNPKDKTIKIDGNLYLLDDNIHDPVIHVIDRGIPRMLERQLGVNKGMYPPTLYLDDIFFKVKNRKRRDGLINHEEGHIKYSKYPIKDYVSKKYGTEDHKTANNKLVKHELKDKNTHATVDEFEADLYATSKSSKNDFKKGLRDYTKYQRKKLKNKHAARNMVDINLRQKYNVNPKNLKVKEKRDEMIKINKKKIDNGSILKDFNINSEKTYNRRRKIIESDNILNKNERNVYKD